MYGLRWSKIKETNYNNIIIVCTGPSLKDFDFERLRNMGYIIAVNDASNFVPFADAWFTLDPWGLTTNQISRGFRGDIFAAVPEDYGTINAAASNHRVVPNSKVNYLHRIPFHTTENIINSDYLSWGLNEDKACINTGNSGYGALNVAYHMRPKNIFLFGLDATRGYFFDVNKSTRSLSHLPLIFKSTLPQLIHANIKVYNASVSSKIECFEKCGLSYAVNMLRNNI